MIVYRTALHSRSIFCTSLRNYKSNIHCCQLHVLSVRPRLNAGSAAVLGAEINQIISRFESSEVGSKDVILNLSQDSVHTTTSTSVDNLPDITPVENTISDIPDIVTEIAVPLNKLGEPVLQSLNLGAYYTPVGWVQNWLEWTHCTFNLPWWAAISACVITARILMSPLVIKTQRNSIKMSNVMPKMQEIQLRMQNARTYGNDMEAMKCGLELAAFMKEKKIKPGATFLLPMLQAPVFISFFMGLRGMANAPVESFHHGGLFWFEDLTLPDPYFVLPIATCVTLFFTIQAGVDFQQIPSTSTVGRLLPKIMKVIPFAVLPFMVNFPCAVCVYWATNNVISLGQVLFLKVPKVRKYFDIEVKVAHSPKASPFNKEGFVKGIKSSWANMRIAKEIEERDRLDEMRFKKAGRAPPAKTFKENPLLKEERIVQAKKN